MLIVLIDCSLRPVWSLEDCIAYGLAGWLDGRLVVGWLSHWLLSFGSSGCLNNGLEIRIYVQANSIDNGHDFALGDKGIPIQIMELA